MCRTSPVTRTRAPLAATTVPASPSTGTPPTPSRGISHDRPIHHAPKPLMLPRSTATSSATGSKPGNSKPLPRNPTQKGAAKPGSSTATNSRQRDSLPARRGRCLSARRPKPRPLSGSCGRATSWSHRATLERLLGIVDDYSEVRELVGRAATAEALRERLDKTRNELAAERQRTTDLER